MKKIRNEFADTVFEVGSKDEKLVVVVGDISHGIMQPFAKKFPERYFNIGICEPSTVNIAAGLNKVGLNPVIHTIAPFLIERSYEQIKLDFGYQKLSGNFVTVGGSFDYSKLGCSHHCYTDVSLIYHLKNSNIVLPGSPMEFRSLFKQIYSQNKINYFRIPENSHNQNFNEDQIIFGKAIIAKEGKDITIAVTGSQLENAMSVALKLEKENIDVEVLYYHTLKPFDYESLRKSVLKTKRLITIEELSAHDGLYNLCLKNIYDVNNLQIIQMAIKDFVHGYGSYEDLCKKAGLSAEEIENNCKKLFKK